jgi:hypothetical protein
MLVLPEMQIEKVLKNGFSVVHDNVDMLDELLKQYPLEMQVEAKQYLSSHNISVVLNWPREGYTLPIIAIVNTGDSEAADKDTLADFLHMQPMFDEELTEREIFGVAKQGTYSLFCNSDDPRLTLYVSLLAETLLILNTQAMQEVGMHNIVLSSGDLNFQEMLQPEWVTLEW